MDGPDQPEGSPTPVERPAGWPDPEPPAAHRWPTNIYVGVMIALIMSVTLNGVLAIRVKDEQVRGRGLQGQIDRQQESLEQLRGAIRGSGGDVALDKIVAAVEQLRGLSFKRDVESALLSAGEFAARVRKEAAEELDPAEVEASERVLVALGVLGPDVDLGKLLVDVQEEQVAGFYDTDEHTLVVKAGDAKKPSPFDRVVLAHEYTHALTDQHFDLGKLDELVEDRDDDAATAYRSLVEGDATLLMRIYQEQILTADEQRRFLEEAVGLSRESFDALPPFLQEVLEFPYTRGLDFVTQLHRRGGFERIDRAYREPPASTEQILHPEKYFDARDDPTEVKMPNVRRALGSGWKVIDRGAIGELDLRVIADEHLSVIDSRRAGDGWDGGAYVGLGSGDDTVVAVLTVWDSVGEAREAATLFGRWLPLRFGNRGSGFDVEGGRGWRATAGAGLVARDEDRVMIVIGPDERTVKDARSAF